MKPSRNKRPQIQECLKPSRNKKPQIQDSLNPKPDKGIPSTAHQSTRNQLWNGNSTCRHQRGRTDKPTGFLEGKTCRGQARTFTSTQQGSRAAFRNTEGRKAGGDYTQQNVFKRQSQWRLLSSFCLFSSFFPFSLFLFFGEGTVRIACQHSYAKTIKGSSLANGLRLDRRASVRWDVQAQRWVFLNHSRPSPVTTHFKLPFTYKPT